ncbi:MAG: C2H2-type zinc finger protein [Candidatus Nitrosocosmicus sp.]
MTSSKETKSRTWNELINESAHTNDDIDIGDIYAINRDFIVIKRGFVNVHYYYIPITQVEGWDGNVVWLKISEEKVKTKYERNDLHPDPSRYFLKDHQIHNPTFLSELVTIPSKIAEPAYSFDIPITTTSPSISEPTLENVQSTYKCDLCNKSNFSTEDELSTHVKSYH